MRYTFKEILKSYPLEKKKSDGIIDHLFNRYASYPLTWLCLNLKIMPNTVTYFSIFICILGVIFSFFQNFNLQILAPICFIFFAILDCVDGNIARTMNARGINRKNAYMGSWVDALGGYSAYITILLSMGASSFYIIYKDNLYYAIGIFFIANIGASANMFMRAIVQSYKLASKTDTKSTAGKSKKISQEIGITGFMPILYLIGIISSYLPYIVLGYAIVYMGGCFITMLRLILKVEKIK